MGDEEAESTLLQIRECFVYKIPPRQTNAGYKCASPRHSIDVTLRARALFAPRALWKF